MDKRGCTSVHFAVNGGDSHILRKVLDLGVDPNLPDNVRAPPGSLALVPSRR